MNQRVDSSSSISHAQHSFAQERELICPACHHKNQVTAWLVVDTVERPELIEQLRDASLHLHTCPQCKRTWPVDAPLLLYWPDRERPFWLSPAQRSSVEQDVGDAQQLLGVLMSRIAPGATTTTVTAERVPRPVLAEALEHGVETAWKLFWEQARASLSPRLRSALWSGSQLGWYKHLKKHPELLGTDSEAELEELQRLVIKYAHEAWLSPVQASLALVRRCRVVGIEVAIAEGFDGHTGSLLLREEAAPFRNAILSAMAAAERHEETRSRKAQDESVKHWERAAEFLSLHPASDELRCAILADTSMSLWRRFRTQGKRHDLEKAFELASEAAKGPDSDRMAVYLTNFGMILHERYLHGRQASDLDQAIAAFEDAVNQADNDHRLLCMNNLGDGLRRRYEDRGAIDDLDRAFAIFQQAQALAADGSRLRPLLLDNLAAVLHDRYRHHGDASDLERAVASSELAVELTPRPSPEWPGRQSRLGLRLREKFESSSNREFLDRAITAFQNATRAAPSRAPDRRGFLMNLARALLSRHEETGQRDDLERAIEISAQVLAECPAASRDLPHCLLGLASGLHARYRRNGQSQDLDREIELLARAVDATLDGAPLMSIVLNNYANALLTRYERTEAMEDLEQALEVHEQALDLSPPSAPQRASRLSNLANTLRALHARFRERHDLLLRSIDLCNQAVEATPEGASEYPRYLMSLGNGYHTLYLNTGEREHLERMIAQYEQAEPMLPAGSLDRVALLNNLGAAYVTHFDISNEPHVLEKAIGYLEAALEQSPSYAPDRASHLNNLGFILEKRHQLTGQIEDLQRGTRAYEQALELGLAYDPRAVLQVASNWGHWALTRKAWEEAARAFTQGIAVAERLYGAQVLRTDKESWLRQVQPLYAAAGYAHARLGDLHQARRVLERGRARLLAEVLERDRTDLEQLEREAPELCAQYRRASDALRQLQKDDLIGVTDGPIAGSVVVTEETPRPWLRDAIRAAHAELDEIIATIQSMPGHERFLTEPELGDLDAASSPGTGVLYVAATTVGTLALLQSRRESEVVLQPIWADAFTDSKLRTLLFGVEKLPSGPVDLRLRHGWFGAYMRFLQATDTSKTWDARCHETWDAWCTAIDATIGQLWPLLMGRVIEAVRASASDQPGSSVDKLVIIPFGLLGLLPLHAAWTNEPDTQSPGSTRRRWVMDDLEIRYAPSLRVLAHAQQVAARCGVDRFLGITAEDLPASQHEVDAAGRRFAKADTLGPEQCTREAIVAAVPGADVCHFACHGEMNWTNPLDSGLLLAGGERLTVRDLLAASTRESRLAVLSACETGVVGTSMPDEVVAFPAAFLQAGFGGVIASLWSVPDASTAPLMMRFYELWKSGSDSGLSAAAALRDAQRWLRDSSDREIDEYLKRYAPGLDKRTAGDSGGCPFSHPVHWAAFYLTGA